MKKLINLIALVMLVSTNVLTPFIYAQDALPEIIPENEVGNVEEIGETPEKNNEITGEIPNSLGEVEGEGNLPLVREVVNETSPAKQGKNLEGLKEEVENSLDAVGSPTTDENKDEDTEKSESDEVAQPVEENTEIEKQEKILEGDEVGDDFLLQKEDEDIVIQVQPGTTATLLSGQQFNQAIKRLAGNSGALYYTSDSSIKQIVYTGTIPSGVTTTGISISDSEKGVVAWYDSGIIYYSSEAETIYLNPDSSYMFYYMQGLTGLDLNNRNASNVTNMSFMFYYCDNISRLDLNSWDVSSVTTMDSMFNGCSSLTGLDLSNWDTSKVTDIGFMFYGCSKLENLDLSNWNTNKVTDIGFIFYNCDKLNQLNLSGWNFSNLGFSYNPFYYSTIKRLDLSNATFSGSMYDVFYNMTNLEEINLSGADMSNVTNMSYMFYNCSNLVDIKGLDTWDTSNVTNMQDMFYNESSLTSLDLSSWDTSNVTDMSYMFNGCSNLTELNLDGWNFSKINSYYNYPLRNNSTIKRLSLSNAIFSGSMNESFYYMTSLEEINLSGADVSNVTNMQEMFRNCENLREIKGLETWDTSNVTNMYEMFQGCSNLTELDLSSFDTSNVTDMHYMFYNCSSLTGLDLSSFDTSKVTSISSIFYGCTKLEELNLSGWNLSKVQYVYASYWGWNDTNMPLKKLNMTNVKFSGSISSLFNYVKNLEELILDGVDTSNVTNMNNMFGSSDKLTSLDLSSFDTSNVTDMSYMFYNCSSLTGLDLSSFDTSKVTSMSSMFYNTPNLKTIYASDKFVTNTLIYNPTDLFYNSINVIGGNGTKFDSGYTDKTYALIDKPGQTGYFTDKNVITVKFINTLDGTETTSTFAKGQKLTPPYVDKYHVAGGYLDEEMTQAIDLNKGVDIYTVIYVKYDRNGSSGGGGGGGGGSTKSDTPKDEQQPAEPSQSDASSGTDVKEPETNTGSNIETGIQVDSSEQTTQNDESNTQDSSTSSQDDGKTYSTEFQEAYEFAKGNGITTMPTIQKANMEGKLTRIAMAKMLSQYAINVLGKTPDTSKTIKFKDVTSKKDADYDNGVTLAYQLGIMGQNMPGNNFRPNDEVTRAEFTTALSRMAYNTSDGEYKSTSKYYIHHMEKLVNEGIITNDNPNMKELRGYVMIMLMRSAKNK